MRHAKAEASAPTDSERRLTDRGAAEAAAAGAWLADQGVVPDEALVSGAVRAVETWEAVAEGAGWDVAVATYDDGLYAAGPESALDLLREVDEGVRTLVLVGHNPTVAYLAQLLDNGEGDEEASAEMVAGYPTAAATVFEYDGDWADLDEASCRVVGFHVARR